MPESLSGFEWASLLVLFLACAVPVLAMLSVTVGAGFLGWKLVARMEIQSRDLMKCVMALSQSQAGQGLAVQMEMTDAQRDKLEADAAQGKPHPLRRAQ